MKTTLFLLLACFFVSCKDDPTNPSNTEYLYYSLAYDSLAYHYFIPQNPPNLHTRFSYFRAEFDFRVYNTIGTIAAGQIGNWQFTNFDTNGHYNIIFNFPNPVDSTIFPFNTSPVWNDSNAYAVFENLKVYIR